jgi:hypothetical protein
MQRQYKMSLPRYAATPLQLLVTVSGEEAVGKQPTCTYMLIFRRKFMPVAVKADGHLLIQWKAICGK